MKTKSFNVTNNVSPATDIAWSYTLQSTINSKTNWQEIIKMAAGQPSTPIEVPTDAIWLSMSYKTLHDGKVEWYEGCKRKMDTISDGDTVEGVWVEPNGKGTCPLY